MKQATCTYSPPLPVPTSSDAGLDLAALPRKLGGRAHTFAREVARELTCRLTRDVLPEPVQRLAGGDPAPLHLDPGPGWRGLLRGVLGREDRDVEGGDLEGRDLESRDLENTVARAQARLRREIRAAEIAQRPPAPVILGGVDPQGFSDENDPYSRDRARLSGALLELLDRFDGLAVTLTTRSRRILDDLDRLIRLDGKHAVTVRIPMQAPSGGGTHRSRDLLGMVEALTARGLAVEILALPGKLAESYPPPWERFFHRVAQAGVQDIRWAPTTRRARAGGPGWVQVSEPIHQIVERLRLEHGFPRALPGRG